MDGDEESGRHVPHGALRGGPCLDVSDDSTTGSLRPLRQVQLFEKFEPPKVGMKKMGSVCRLVVRGFSAFSKVPADHEYGIYGGGPSPRSPNQGRLTSVLVTSPFCSFSPGFDPVPCSLDTSAH